MFKNDFFINYTMLFDICGKLYFQPEWCELDNILHYEENQIKYETYNPSQQIHNLPKIWEEYIEITTLKEKKWLNKLDLVKKYIDKHDKKPSEDSRDSATKRLGNWIKSQKRNYKIYNSVMINDKIRKIWEDFLNKYDKYFPNNELRWHRTLNMVIKYIVRNGKKPRQRSKNKNISRLGHWIYTQLRNYKYSSRIMKKHKFRAIWENFIIQYGHLF